jgi:hypothetical protein
MKCPACSGTQKWHHVIALLTRRYPTSMRRPYASNAAATPTTTAAVSGTPVLSSSNAAPEPTTMELIAAIMLALVKKISASLVRKPLLASAAAVVSLGEVKNSATAGSSVT